MKTASYARQSIEKQDSVSIDTQFEKCELICRLNNWECTHYSDVGYSGSNINRPAFEQLIRDIKQGKIDRVVSYRLDRISRSITDFANLLQLFEKYNIQYISATENFDTSTPLGRAMVYIVMVFAQLERETITQRITDNYYFRARQGLFMGGNCPLGYQSVKIDKNGKKTSVLEIDPESSVLVKRIFELFVTENYNANSIALLLNEKGIRTQKNSTWTRNKVARILQNPAYAANTPDVYGYFSHLSCIMAQSPEEYTGTNGICIYGKEKNYGSGRKPSAASEQIVTIGGFPPLVSSDIWLAAQYKLSCKKAPSRSGTGETTWLSGLIGCSLCGHSMSIKSSVKNGKKYCYIYCRGRSSRGVGICSSRRYYELSELEVCIEESVIKKISSPDFAKYLSSIEIIADGELTIRKNSLLSKIYTIESEINTYIEQIGKGAAIIDKYLNQKITDLDTEKASLQKEIDEIDMKSYNDGISALNPEYLSNVALRINSTFKASDVQTKKVLASALIKKILLDDGNNITIEWFL